MESLMLALEKLADWWDRRKKESENALDSFVDRHPNLFGVAVAGSTKTAMDLGAGFVDVLRVGEGVKQGGWGYGRDALRVVSLAGPAARVGRMALTKFIPDVAGPLCARVSATQALRMTGTKHFAAVEDVIKSLSGKVISSMTEIAPELQQFRAGVRNLGPLNSLEHVRDLVNANPKGVITFAVKWVQRSGGEAAHSLVAYRDWIGRVRFLDRTGAVFGDLEELEQAMQRAGKTYNGIEKAVPYGEALHLANSTVVTALNGTSMIAVETRSLMLTSMYRANQLFDEFRNQWVKGITGKGTAARH
jgi:hypothetical protein